MRGFAQSFGVFENYYRTHEPFSESTEIASIGTCAMVRYFSVITDLH
jgi:hypothetical protein